MPKGKVTEEENIRLAKFYQEHNCDRKLTHHHFQAIGISKRRINMVLARVEQGKDLQYNKNSGPKPTVTSQKNINKAIKLFGKNPGLSVRDAAIKMNIPHASMNDIRRKAGIRSKVKRKVPKLKPQQIESAKKNCLKLYKKCVPSGGNYFIIMDDETYMELDPQEAKKKQWVSITPGYELSEEDQIVQKSKFPAKMLVWQAITQDGRVSPPYVSSGTMNSIIYRDKCLKAILKPWLQSLNIVEPILFWPDKATCHYANITLDFLRENGIDYVRKIDNPTSIPQCRPIERFWALCKTDMIKQNKVTYDPSLFKRRWTVVSKTVAEKSGKNLFNKFKAKLRLAAKEGPWSVCLKKF